MVCKDFILRCDILNVYFSMIRGFGEVSGGINVGCEIREGRFIRSLV